MTTIKIEQTRLFESRDYKLSLVGLRVAITTPAGTRVEGVVEMLPLTDMLRPLSGLIVREDSGRWAPIGTEERLEVVNA
jgi:hypothetical protein